MIKAQPTKSASPPPLESQDRAMLDARSHIPSLDGLRGIAIFMVIAFHFGPDFANTGWEWPLSAARLYCGNGVTLFFALSGFLITGILWDSKTGVHYFRNFYARRTLRIFPLYYAVLFVALVVIPLIHVPNDPKFQSTVAHQGWLWIYASNFYEAMTGRAIPLFGHFWSLAVEEQFYLVWPLVVWAFNKHSLQWICVACIMIALASRYAVYATDPAHAATLLRITPCNLDALAIGAWIALAGRSAGIPWNLVMHAKTIAFITSILLAACILSNAISLSTPKLLVGVALLNVIFLGALLAAIIGFGAPPVANRLLSSAPLRAIGKFSYALYVFHWPIGVFIKVLAERKLSGSANLFLFSTIAGQALLMLLIFAVSLAAAWVSWNLYEKHFLRLKRYFAPEPTALRKSGLRRPGEASA